MNTFCKRAILNSTVLSLSLFFTLMVFEISAHLFAPGWLQYRMQVLNAGDRTQKLQVMLVGRQSKQMVCSKISNRTHALM